MPNELAAAGVPLGGRPDRRRLRALQLDRVTADEIAGILEAAWNDEEMRPWFTSFLPVAGISGTLSDRMRRPPARGHVPRQDRARRPRLGAVGIRQEPLRGSFYAHSLQKNGISPLDWRARCGPTREYRFADGPPPPASPSPQFAGSFLFSSSQASSERSGTPGCSALRELRAGALADDHAGVRFETVVGDLRALRLERFACASAATVAAPASP